MKYLKLDLLTLLISLFIFSSCKKEGTIGLDLAPQDSINSIYTDTITIFSTTVLEESVQTSGITQNALGLIKDPVFGSTEANLALALGLPSDNYSFGSNPMLDSAILVLKYGDEFQGDSLTSNYTINVHQLKQPYNTTKPYYSTSNFGNYSDAPLIGSLSNIKRFRWRDSTTINTIVKGGPDKPITIAPQIRIPLDPDFVKSKLIAAGATNLKNNIAFINHLQGLYVTINKGGSSGNGGIIFLDLPSIISKVDVYYRTNTSGVIDTSLASFKVLSGASEIRHDKTGTPVGAQLNSTGNNSNQSTVFVQGLGGVRTKLRFPHLLKLLEKGNISVNRAELVVPILENTDNPLKPAPRLALYRSDIAAQRQPVPDNTFLPDGVFGGFYNSTNKNYTFNITTYIQNLLSKKLTQYDTFIAPSDLPRNSTPNIAPSATTARRSVLGGSTHPQRPIKLKLTYTRPN